MIWQRYGFVEGMVIVRRMLSCKRVGSQNVREQILSRYQTVQFLISSHFVVLTTFRASRIVPLFSGSKDPDQFSHGSFCIPITFFRFAFQLDCFSPRALFNRVLFDPLQ